MEIALVLSLLVIAIILFAMEKFSIDVVTLSLIIVLTGFGILTPKQAFEGFSSDFMVILASIFVISGAMQETGLLDQLGGKLVKAGRKRPRLMLFYTMLIPGSISAFMNNTTVTALFVNPLMGLARKAKISPSKILMPMCFATILGGTCTLIGTSTNIAGSALMANYGMDPLSMFELLPAGLFMFGIGLLYLATIGRRMLPDHKQESLGESFGMREYLSEILVVKGSPLAGQSVFKSNLSKLDFRILEIIRGNNKLFPVSDSIIEEEDVLLVEGNLEKLLQAKETEGIIIRAEALDVSSLLGGEVKIAEVLVTPMSDLLHSTIREAKFRQRFGVVVLAVHRHGQSLKDKIGDIRLQVGDLLLVQGPSSQLDYLKTDHSLAVLDRFKPRLYNKREGWFTLSVFILAVIIGSLGWLPLSVSFLTAAVLSVLFGAVTPEKAYEYIEWKALIMIGGMSAFGTAMTETGTNLFLSDLIINNLGAFGPWAIMVGFMVVTVILTQPLSNAAAALVMLPIAIQTALDLHVDARSFSIAIILSASISMITPFEPACILIYGPGKYKVMDFIRVGGGITLILLLLLSIYIPFHWPL